MYEIGQILYIIANGSKTIEPVQVHSKQILESWDGTTVQHMCATTSNKTISLEKHSEKGLLAGVFESAEDAKLHLLKLAAEMVEKLVSEAKTKSRMFEKQDAELEKNDDTQEIISAPIEENTIVLEDGTKARIHLPDSLK